MLAYIRSYYVIPKNSIDRDSDRDTKQKQKECRTKEDCAALQRTCTVRAYGKQNEKTFKIVAVTSSHLLPYEPDNYCVLFLLQQK